MKNFYLGMDIGTNSVGMACTDEEYNLLKASGQKCWAVRLFDESKTAAERRTFRSARRRVQRIRQRINLLQSLFAPYIEDETFFIRLNNSQFFPEDKDSSLNKDTNNLFNDKNFKDKDFYKKYITIYHLRDALQKECIHDLRLYYLALHHIIKYRGHFLFEGNVNDVRNAARVFEQINETGTECFGEDFVQLDVSLAEKVKDVLSDENLGVKEKKKALEELLSAKDETTKEIIKAISGGKFSPAILFGESFSEEKNFSFKDTSDETFEGMQSIYGDYFEFLAALRNFYGFITFEKLLKGHENISTAMIAVYEKHKHDLKLLKDFLKENVSREEYNRFFKSTSESANYVKYIGYTKKGGEKKKVKKCKKDKEFYAYLKKFLTDIKEVSDQVTLNKILSEVENETFLPKILHSDNGLFPHQINEAELIKIVEKMVTEFPETKEMSTKILPLFRFRIPYYVGPLTGKNSWVKRRAEGKITPWNFNELVDLAASNEAFMRRMTNKCTYLKGEDVLPKSSIIYQKYNVLNQLNKLKINGIPVSQQLKENLFNDLFLKHGKASDKQIINYLIKKGWMSESDSDLAMLEGKDGDFKATMSSYISLKKILGDFVDEDIESGSGVCEKIILWHTLNTDKNIVEQLIKNNFSKIPIIKNNIRALKGLSFRDFGRLSEKLLIGLKSVDKTTGEYVSIMDVLEQTTLNLNEILFSERFDFNRLIREENGEQSTKVTYDDIKELYVSPAVRRGINQALIMADEYVSAIGKEPDKIFIEVTREEGVKGDAGKTVSRKKQLFEKYNKLEGFEDIISELKSDDITDLKLRSERLYLYFRQLGKCMYSGERIDLSNLNTNSYDVDHILPRKYVKDDSLDNKVLVCRAKNAEKADKYPLPESFTKQKDFWQLLLDKGLISKVTYARLTRTSSLTEEDYNDFINRQKVITDQTAKAVAELIGRKYPSATVVYSKAKNVNDFKSKFKLVKCRETNDLHHARDAYLNVVVGNVYHTSFSTAAAKSYTVEEGWKSRNLDKLFTVDVAGAWSKENSLTTVKNTYSQSSMAVTRYTYVNKGGFYDQTVYPADNKGISAPRKGKGILSDIKYGGYKSQSTSYFAVVKSLGKKGETIKTIEAVPIMVAYQAEKDQNKVLEYFESYLNSPEIIVSKLKIKQLVEINGTLAYLAGTTGGRIILHNATQLFTDGVTDSYVNALQKLIDMDKNNLVDKNDVEYVISTNRFNEIRTLINPEQNKNLYSMLKNKLYEKRYQGLGSIQAFLRNLENGESIFNELSTIEQSKVLVQILKFFKCNAETSDLELLKSGKSCGDLLIGKNVFGIDLKLVYQSPCGLKTRVRTI